MKKKSESRVLLIPLSGKKTLLIMKQLIFLMCVLNLNVFSEINAQRINEFRVQNANLKSCIKKVEQLTGMGFMYNGIELEKVTGIDVNLRDVGIETLLDAILCRTGYTYELINGVIAIRKEKQKNITAPQVKQKLAQGVVTDKQGNSLPGVSVFIKGTTLGTSTDVKGFFKFEVPEVKDMVLVFSFVGMKKKEVKLVDDTPLKVTMEDDEQSLDEVVVNGMFTQKKNSYTGSVTTMHSEELLQVSQTNLLKAISILTPGLRMVENNEMGSDPNHIPEIIIRGTTSIASNGEQGLNTPLIILDGVEISLENLYDLEINDIERVDVLKDASATSIYGEKAANGVIVVERKRVEDSKLRLRYTFTPSFSFPDVSCYDYCDAAQKLELERRAGLYSSVDGSGDLAYNTKFKKVASGINTDWMSKPLRNSSSFSHSLSVTGRGSGMDYGITARYSDTRGVMKEDYRNNYGIGFYFSYRLVDKLTITYRADIGKTGVKNSPYGSFSQYVELNPYDTPMDNNGNWNKRLSYDVANPLYNATTGSFNKSRSKTITNSLNARWDIWQGFYATGSFNYTFSDSQGDAFISPEHSIYVKESDPTKKGSYSKTGSESSRWQLKGGITYSKSLDERGTILTVNVGANAEKNQSSSFNFSGIGFLKPMLTDINYANGYPEGRPGGGEQLSTSVGFFANMNFICLNKYFVDGSYRVSGSSKFGAERRFAPFWSVGAGWNIHNENFLKENGIVQILRLRASMGYTGSVNFSDNQAVTTYRYNQDYNYYIGMGAVPITMGNEYLKWQTTINYNTGLTLEMLKNRLSINFDVYKQKTKDMLLSVSMPPSVGVISLMDNLGETSNWGYEWSVSGMPVKTQELYWRIGVSSHHTVNKLLKISNATKRQNDQAKGETNLTAPKLQFEEGESANAIYAVRSLGIDPATGNEVFVKKDGSYTFLYDVNDKVALGNTTPKFEGAITTAFGWKGISISAALSFTLGGDIYNSTRASKVENIDPQKNVDVRAFTERWGKAGDIVHYTNVMNKKNYVHSQRFIERKNELYLSSLNISYELKPQWVKRIGLKKLLVGVGMSDIGRLSTVKYERGTSYPYARGYNFTISPTF